MLDTDLLLIPRFRKTQFNFSGDIPRYWSANDPVRTHFANAFSILLPEYEKLFIATLAARLKELKLADQSEAAKQFCAQEGQHAHVHRGYNQWLVSLGYSGVPKIEAFFRSFLNLLVKYSSKSWLLALTAGGEHITSFMANDFLTHPEKWINGPTSIPSEVWAWHAAEEIEHKAVCYDAYQTLVGRLWLRRSAFVFILLQSLLFASAVQAYLLWKDRMLFRKSTWTAQSEFMLGRDGFIAGVSREVKKYLKKDFHPWQTRDGHLVTTWEKSRALGT